MRLTQGAFSFLPDLTDDQIKRQISYIMTKNWSVNIEFTDDPHPRNAYWELWGLPLFDIKDPSVVMYEISSCRKANTNCYLKINAFDNSRGVESCVMSFIITRPSAEPGFRLVRQEMEGRLLRYTVESYAAAANPEGYRY
uniref:Multifunctional fusion protein n=1 Tax=Corynoplastis japonica TaxID=700918 RepID=A0A1X9PVT9_9RHOD|nr:ribulose bisphosphate carboxylase small subunit [Corynoplastis japonica]